MLGYNLMNYEVNSVIFFVKEPSQPLKLLCEVSIYDLYYSLT